MTIGSSPGAVVIEVSTTGRRHCAPVRRAASSGAAPLIFRSLQVSIRTMSLLAAIPASAMIPTRP